MGSLLVQERVREFTSCLDQHEAELTLRVEQTPAKAAAAEQARLLRCTDSASLPAGAIVRNAIASLPLEVEAMDADQWIVAARAAVVLYAKYIERLLGTILPLGNDVLYWEDVMSSDVWTMCYMLQTTPLRLARLAKEVSHEFTSKVHAAGPRYGARDMAQFLRASLRSPEIVVRGVFAVGNGDMKRQPLSRYVWTSLVRREVKSNMTTLRKLRKKMSERIGRAVSAKMSSSDDGFDAKSQVPLFLSTILPADVEDMPPRAQLEQLQLEIDRLNGIVPRGALMPGLMVRYWPTLVACVTCGSYFLNVVAARKQDIATWLLEAVDTARAFWYNWVISPCASVIKTIRHTDDSQIAITSKKSLLADLDSLERMVVSFAEDRKQYAVGFVDANGNIDSQRLMNSVKEGDMSPVLRAYEHDLQSPLRGTVMGDLVRALLIQVQKTKVDVQQALSGIDRILRSQELVFGFVGLTPGMMVCYFTFTFVRDHVYRQRYAGWNRSSRVHMRRVLRNIGRLLDDESPLAVPSDETVGMLLCETFVLREIVSKAPLPNEAVRSDFYQDISSLEDASGRPYATLHQRLNLIFQAYGPYL